MHCKWMLKGPLLSLLRNFGEFFFTLLRLSLDFQQLLIASHQGTTAPDVRHRCGSKAEKGLARTMQVWVQLLPRMTLISRIQITTMHDQLSLGLVFFGKISQKCWQDMNSNLGCNNLTYLNFIFSSWLLRMGLTICHTTQVLTIWALPPTNTNQNPPKPLYEAKFVYFQITDKLRKTTYHSTGYYGLSMGVSRGFYGYGFFYGFSTP